MINSDKSGRLRSSLVLRGLLVLLMFIPVVRPQDRTVSAPGDSTATAVAPAQGIGTTAGEGDEGLGSVGDGIRATPYLRMRGVTPAQRKAAAERAAPIRRAIAAARAAEAAKNPAQKAPIFMGPLDAQPGPNGNADYFYGAPNFALSQLPNVTRVNGVVTAVSGGIRKFVDALPGLGPNSANLLGQYIPVAQPTTPVTGGSAFQGTAADYYEIGLAEFSVKMHSDIPSTKIRGFRDLGANAQGLDSGVGGDGKGAKQYLGPLIIATQDKPVRIKFSNNLTANGSLFLPIDTSVMGAGRGPDGTLYSPNRGEIHLHGGATPWISDGTPHQWITPAGETTTYKKGLSFQNVPDMAGTGKVISSPSDGDGLGTYYYTNQQSGRLMFYHDHSYGATRLSVYAGEAAGYLLHDTVEDNLISTGVLPNQNDLNTAASSTYYTYGIPLIIQDKTFVPDSNQLAAQDPTWNWGPVGNLWFPHVYMPNQNPADDAGASDMGRWDYGAWFWPPQTNVVPPPVPAGTGTCPSVPAPVLAVLPGPFVCPGTPNPSTTPEAFMDTPVVNGTAYPYLTVGRRAYRFRILNAANDRHLNLGLYFADPSVVNIGEAAPKAPAQLTEVKMVTAEPHPNVAVNDGNNDADDLRNCQAGDPIDPVTQLPKPVGGCWPATWPEDGREGGVPDPQTAGPAMIQIGTEGGFLVRPVVIPSTPVGYNYNRRDIVVLNITTHGLLLGPAERADVIIDFSGVPAGSRLILYNDSPAPVPANDPRTDYFTGAPDYTSTGGAPSPVPGFGPNTRTVMQFRVDGAAGNSTATGAFSLTALNAAFPAAFNNINLATALTPATPIIVPEVAYGATRNTYARIQSSALTVPGLGSVPVKWKAIHELFDPMGRMNSILGTELPLTSFLTQTTIPLQYIDPPTEIVNHNETQLWKITHNGVDTHAVHFHLFNVQLVNRVGWDGAVRPPEANELGWKETVRMNPLEDAIVALKPVMQNLPWTIPESIRPLDVTTNLGTTGQFTNIDPFTNNPQTITNVMTNFGYEYVWHCHLLGHEDNDMMRPIVFKVPTGVGVSTLSATAAGPNLVNLSWSAISGATSGYFVQRATGAGAFAQINSVAAGVLTYSDSTALAGATYSYKVVTSPGGVASPTATVTTPLATPTTVRTLLAGAGYVILGWTETPTTSVTGYTIQRSPNGTTGWATVGTTIGATTTTFRNTGLVKGASYYYRVVATGAAGLTSAASTVFGPVVGQ